MLLAISTQLISLLSSRMPSVKNEDGLIGGVALLAIGAVIGAVILVVMIVKFLIPGE